MIAAIAVLGHRSACFRSGVGCGMHDSPGDRQDGDRGGYEGNDEGAKTIRHDFQGLAWGLGRGQVTAA